MGRASLLVAPCIANSIALGSQVENIVGRIDVNGDQLIDYEEFIAATIHLSKLNKEDVMIEAFKYFDKDNSGFITADELLVSPDLDSFDVGSYWFPLPDPKSRLSPSTLT